MAPNLPKLHRPKVYTAQMQDERILGERRKEAVRNSISRDLQMDALIRNQEKFFEIAEQKRRYRESIVGMNSIGGVDTHAEVDTIPLRNAGPPGISNHVSKHDTEDLDANSTFDLDDEALKQKIINSSPELKDLKRKLNFALLAQEWQAQVEAHKAQEVQAKQLVAAETLLELQRMELEETKRRETEANRAKEYRVSLKHQLEQHQAAKTQQEMELKLQEQKLDALQMQRLDSRFEADKTHRARQQNELLKYLELSQQLKEADKQKEKQRLNREEEEIKAYNQLLLDRQSLLAEKHAQIEQEKQSIYNKLYNDLLNAEQARQQAYDATLDIVTVKHKEQQLKKEESELEYHKQKKLEALKELQQQILENTISRHQAKLQERELNQKVPISKRKCYTSKVAISFKTSFINSKFNNSKIICINYSKQFINASWNEMNNQNRIK